MTNSTGRLLRKRWIRALLWVGVVVAPGGLLLLPLLIATIDRPKTSDKAP